MDYIPNTDADRAEMLKVVGVETVADLFHDVPEQFRFPKLDLPPALTEMEMLQELQALADENDDLNHLACFLGAGAYNHFVPKVVDSIISRGEFYTAYTPYQPEISQGTLQAHFEYQSMITALTGMEVSNVSHYDGATAVAEAVIMALQVGRNKRCNVILSPTLNPQYRDVVHTYTQGMCVKTIGENAPLGDLNALADMCDKDAACVIVQNPDFLGRLYLPAEMQALADRVHGAGAMLIVACDPISLGLFTPPGHYGADVACGEAQPMGNSLSLGGPYVGFFAMKMGEVRKSAGRIVGQTVDVDEERGFVLTLSTREQHIRREKASSNICTNQALNALAAAIYMAAMGKHGLKKAAELTYHKAHYAAKLVDALDDYAVKSDGPFFKEFVVQCPLPIAELNERLLNEWGIVGGYDLGADYPELKDHMLVCVTEMNSKVEIETLAEALAAIAAPASEDLEGQDESLGETEQSDIEEVA